VSRYVITSYFYSVSIFLVTTLNTTYVSIVLREKNSLNYKALLLESSITMEIEYKSLTHCLTHLNFLKLQSL